MKVFRKKNIKTFWTFSHFFVISLVVVIYRILTNVLEHVVEDTPCALGLLGIFEALPGKFLKRRINYRHGMRYLKILIVCHRLNALF